MSVFANGLGVSGKAMDNKTLAAMPDVCMSPPPPPAGPVPIPYPNFGMASDTTDGCTSVFLKGKEAGKKNASKYSKITGDEPATRSFGGSVVTANITGPLKFEAYSFDVLFEGGGANRFTDLTSTNHSNPGSGVSASIRDADVPVEPPDPDCAVLRSEANAMRKASDDTSRAEQKIYGNDRAADDLIERAFGALTATQEAGKEIVRRTSNALNARACNQRGLPVAEKTDARSKKSKVCGGGKPYKDKEKKNHTEAQMLENINWESPPKWVAFATDWPGYDRKTKRCDPKLANGPCEDCQKKLDEACACGLKIILCDSDGNPRDYCDK